MQTKSIKVSRTVTRMKIIFTAVGLFMCSSIVFAQQGASLVKLPELNYTEPFNDNISSILDIKGSWRWVSMDERWFIDFENKDNEFRVLVNPISPVYSDLFLSKVAKLEDVNTTEGSIRFVFYKQNIYIPKPRAGGSFWGDIAMDLAEGVTGSPKIGTMAGRLAEQAELEQAAKDVAKTTQSSYEFNLRLRDNVLVGTLKTIIYQTDAAGRVKEFQNDIDYFILFRAPNKYTGAKTLSYYDIRDNEKKKQKNEQFQDLMKELVKKKSKGTKEIKGEALNNIGFLYLNGLGVSKSVNTAMTHFKEAAKTGNTTAMCNIAYLVFEEVNENKVNYNNASSDSYYVKNSYKKKFEKKKTEALQWYSKAADTGDKNAVYMLGLTYLNGLDKIEKDDGSDYAKAKAYFEDAERLGSVDATNALGYIYYNGLGVNKDYYKAFAYYKTAADKALPQALTGLGRLYFNGYGVEQNFERALEYYYMAARLGDRAAVTLIALMYFNYSLETEFHDTGIDDFMARSYYGILPVNHVEAMKWFRLADILSLNQTVGMSTLSINGVYVLDALK